MAESLVVGVVAVGRSTFDTELAARTAEQAFAVLRGLDVLGGVDQPDIDIRGTARLVLEPDEVGDVASSWGSAVDVVVILQATFTDSRFTAEAGALADRVLVWSFPEEPTGGRLRLNSLCGAILAANELALNDRQASFVHLDPARVGVAHEVWQELCDEPRSRPPLDADPLRHDPSVEAADMARSVRARLESVRLGVIGDSPDGFGPCATVSGFGSLNLVADRHEMDELFELASGIEPSSLSGTRSRIEDRAEGLDLMTADEPEPSLRLHGALERMVKERGWHAVATRCWPECFTEQGGAICTPLGLLADDGVPGACEADMLGSLTMLVLGWLAEDAATLLDLVAVDAEDDTCVMWHCGVSPISMADPARRVLVDRHPNREMALVNRFGLRPGRVTLARMSNSRGVDRIVVGTGEVLDREPAFRGTVATVRFDRPASEVLATLTSEGLDHHLGLVYGDVADSLVALAAELGVGVVQL